MDPGFRFLLGQYYARVRESYPHFQELPAAQLPEDMAAFVVRHQFRASEDGWPVTQLGPGILTVNETDGYTWESFEPKILEAAHAVYEAYPQELAPFKPVSAILRYQNALPYDPQTTSPLAFLRDKLHTSIDIDADLFNGPGGVQEPTVAGLNAVFPLSELPGQANLQISSGTNGGRPAIILDTSIRSQGDATPNEKDSLKTWLDSAHAIAESWFFTLCRGELLEQFQAKS